MRGFSLAEAILALGLCCVVLLLVVALAISANRTQRKSSATLVANSYAGQVLEEFVYSLPPAGDDFWSHSTFTNPYAQDQSQLGPVLYQSRLFLEPMGTVAPGLLRCTVNVSWSAGAQQGNQALSISRLLYAP
ncbi:MAG: hypothetical protein KF760_32305 [Candidatus Eremiobacteraeota bacterium]|nr:hypothetical protein [Candidatus Eremiobacteraeota bacterium]MCW5871591.1 hypothetical protein [Candidatus Eremiobacteraeota bacterium]